MTICSRLLCRSSKRSIPDPVFMFVPCLGWGGRWEILSGDRRAMFVCFNELGPTSYSPRRAENNPERKSQSLPYKQPWQDRPNPPKSNSNPSHKLSHPRGTQFLKFSNNRRTFWVPQELIDLAKRHIVLVGDLFTRLPKHHLWIHVCFDSLEAGNPRHCACWHDESLNRTIKKVWGRTSDAV